MQKSSLRHSNFRHHFKFPTTALLYLTFLISYFLFSTAAPLLAQSVRWEPSTGSLARDQVSRINLVFENCKPKGSTVTVPQVAGLQFGDPSTHSSVSFDFGTGRSNSSKSVTSLIYPVRPTGTDKVVIPTFQVETTEGKITVPSATFSVGEPTVARGQSQTRLEDVANSRVIFPQREIWAGEVFPLTYNIAIAERFSPRLPGNPEWESAPLVLEDWPQKPTVTSALRNGQPFASVDYNTRAFCPQTGTFTLPALSQTVALATGRSSFFGQDYSQYAVRSEATTVTVKPLPQPAPANFAGAVGNFSLTAKVVPEKVTVGEPVTWTLELAGTGNWPAITALPARSVSNDFRVIQPRAQKTISPEKLFDGRLAEDVILVPTKPGKYQLGPVGVSVFNPATGVYEVLHTDTVTIEVMPAENASPALVTGAPTSPAPPTTLPSLDNATTPSAPAAIPRDPLPPAEPVMTPVNFSARLPWLIFAGIWPFAGWLILAHHRARRTDPLLPRRHARERLLRTTASLATQKVTAEKRTALLLAWQHDAAIFWNITDAAPSAAQLKNERWAQLWREADRALYHRDAALPDDWILRAKQALADARLPAFKWRSLLFGKNIFPFFTILVTAVCALGVTTPLHADEPSPSLTAYQSANFSAAENGWRAQTKQHPTDWAAHHNLSLALAQQDRWGESAAHAIVAFVQQPHHPDVRWQLHLALGKSGHLPELLKPFANETPQASLAGLTSPVTWQHALYGGVFLIATGVMLALLRGYKFLGKWARVISVMVMITGALGVTAAIYSLKTYGTLGDEHAAIVWKSATLYSVPTEADEEQKTTPVSAGSVVLVEKDFLGWRRIAFSNGQTGWIRAENLVTVWTQK